ncbi:MAG: type VI secretion system baseplate subunit TssE [Pirellulales bacterium]|nr:type VI secretion system baseplate subunit TssE [Pirellulales bacterium]
MAKIREDQPLMPSVLDRLIDHDPGNQRDAPNSRAQVLRELKQSVRRDLESLLNTRRRCLEWPPVFTELETSLVNYGIPDFTGTTLSRKRQREEFRRTVEKVIRVFEPRFKVVQVEMLDNSEPTDHTLRFRINALLHAEPAPEPVVFDSSLEPISGTYEVKGGGR